MEDRIALEKRGLQNMTLRLYQYGHCADLPGLSIGVARQAPRGIRVEDRFRKGYFQVWMPLLAPSKDLYQAYRRGSISYQQFANRYRSEMDAREPRQAISLLAATCRQVRVNLGCFCENDANCHRSLLATLIEKAAKDLPEPIENLPGYFSPPCSMPEIED